ncbi:hypothetical protein BDEG_28064 [Batrachochytrium dendrobatidis JEL423]|uniref:Uncharacterized protein n=1 Tax=Batrachochytrium dendrobatidis (strain JEL423) TaxID=403673 RepID=A0A177WZP9_BATDL|nr:hypothetical protein BDEG_28064 [Batrachochytrium dendrobatidis JEL423]
MKQAVIFVISLLAAMSSAIVVSTSESPAPTFEPSPSPSTSGSTSGSHPPSAPALLFRPHSDTRVASLFSRYNILLGQYNSKVAECKVLKQDCEDLDSIARIQTLTHTLTLDKCNRDKGSSKKMRLKATSNCMKENLKKAKDVYLQSLAKKIHICGEVSRLKARMNEVEAKVQNLLFNNQQ